MSRTLYLLRHAQAADAQQGQQDYERNLTSQGLREASTIAGYLKKNKIIIDLVVTSTAFRALSTARTIAEILNLKIEIEQNEEIFHASVRTLLEVLNNQSDEYKSLLLIGHNPYISYFAEFLTKEEVGSLAPAGLATIKFDISNWAEVSEGNGSLESYFDPSMID